MFQERIDAALRLLDIQEASLTTVVCDAVGDLPADVRDDFLVELLTFAEKFKGLKAPSNWCNAEDAVRWFIEAFRREVKAQHTQDAAALARTAARRALFVPAITVVGMAIAAVLFILFLPLLIQIERNTRPLAGSASVKNERST
ncbi:MAG: hypothetical protein FJ167_07300 [Gammaproteobacteria bacterium]|nr:hypothetical protein [Gammaproteobacteria bacterium]